MVPHAWGADAGGAADPRAYPGGEYINWEAALGSRDARSKVALAQLLIAVPIKLPASCLRHQVPGPVAESGSALQSLGKQKQAVLGWPPPVLPLLQLTAAILIYGSFAHPLRDDNC